jgi:hypothetical protein
VVGGRRRGREMDWVVKGECIYLGKYKHDDYTIGYGLQQRIYIYEASMDLCFKSEYDANHKSCV